MREEAWALRHTPGARARRWVVEGTHSCINRFRALLVRWDSKTANYEGALHLGCAYIACARAVPVAVSAVVDHRREVDAAYCGSSVLSPSWPGSSSQRSWQGATNAAVVYATESRSGVRSTCRRYPARRYVRARTRYVTGSVESARLAAAAARGRSAPAATRSGPRWPPGRRAPGA